MTIILEQDDLKELLRLNDEASNTPVIALSLADGLAGRDFASLAWNRVRDKWEEFGKKYDFDPTKVKGIKRDTGEVLV